MKNNFKTGMIVLVWFAVITVVALFSTSCTASYSVSERKIAPIVNDYDVKHIKTQTASNVKPK